MRNGLTLSRSGPLTGTFKECECEDVKWINLTADGVYSRVLVETVSFLQVP